MNSRSSTLPAAGRILLGVYSALLTGALGLSAPWWVRGLRRGGKYREGLRERLGRIPRERLTVPDRVTVWVHAVSVGEVLAAAPLILQLRAARPDARVYVSTTTRTGQAIARARFGAETVFYFPADFRFAVRAWLRFLRPSLLVLVESEFWPRLLFEASRAGIPVAVVNGRVSPRSWPRYRRLRRLWRPLLATLAVVQAQSEHDAKRMRSLGAANARNAGNLKYDLQPPADEGIAELLREHLPPGAPLLICGSTLAGEEDYLLSVLPTEPVILLAPRHPERFEQVAQMLTAQPRPWVRLSAWRQRPAPIAPGSVLLLDSVGELAALYTLATVAIIGGGILHPGGHNPLEAAQFTKPIVMGPHAQNFAEIVTVLRDAHAIVLAESGEIASAVEHLLAHPEEAAAMGARAELVCRMRAGATRRALAALLPLLPPAEGPRP